MTAYLLDVNVLLALLDPMHIHHEPVHRWFASTNRDGWATCPITENGFLRIASHPRYPNRPGEFPAVQSILRQLLAAPGHQFWPDDVGILDALRPEAIVTHAQLTDLYLLGLAAHHNGKLATFDRTIPADTVAGGPEALELIEP